MPPRHHPTRERFQNRILIFEAATVTVAEVGISEDSREFRVNSNLQLVSSASGTSGLLCQESSIGHPQNPLSKGHGRRLGESDWKRTSPPALCCWRWMSQNLLVIDSHGGNAQHDGCQLAAVSGMKWCWVTQGASQPSACWPQGISLSPRYWRYQHRRSPGSRWARTPTSTQNGNQNSFSARALGRRVLDSDENRRLWELGSLALSQLST